MEAYDLLVIGSGPAGEKGAAQAAYFGKRVAIVEKGNVGGAVVNTGTLPSKTLRETALYLSGLKQRGLYGVDYTLNKKITVDDLFYRKKSVVDSHLGLVKDNIARHNITLFRGVASVEDARTVRVNGADGNSRLLRGEYILVSTGSRPHRPPEVPFDGEYVYDSDSILNLKRIPSSLVVLGAGVIGSEYTTVFAALGLEVTVIDRGERLLPFLDREIADILLGQIRGLGVRVMFGRELEGIQVNRKKDCVSVSLDGGEELQAGAVLFCGGRSGNTDGLGLEKVGVKMGPRGRIEVNENFQSSVPNIYAAGDVIGFPALASTSMEQGRVAACHAFSLEYKQCVSPLVPYGVYTIPEISMVGESEDSLARKGQKYLVGRASYRSNPRGQIMGDTAGLLKLLFSPEDQKLLGVHIIGERASELVHIGQACMYFDGTLDFFIQNVFNFPTLSDVYKYAAYDGLGNLQRYRDGQED
ncbi:MAG: Si-specific NAD(P)(+) transhydrogenase [Candidatus Eiseniibacteriota bacterium]|nr:MAG: Si-specific NAD(P)(+) transhydrogenase [Candidatus Eisenbacteria bacterium]